MFIYEGYSKEESKILYLLHAGDMGYVKKEDLDLLEELKIIEFINQDFVNLEYKLINDGRRFNICEGYFAGLEED